jgi:SagB-type dehydrogenase family enzyme
VRTEELQHHLMDRHGLHKADSEEVVGDFVQSGLVRTSETYPDKDPGSLMWLNYNWGDSWEFHSHMRALMKSDISPKERHVIDRQLMSDYCRSEAVPSNFKDYGARHESIVLPDFELYSCSESRNLSEVFLTAGALDRDVEQDAWSLSFFSWFTGFCFGKVGTKELFATGEHIVKTSPSGGSRHPTEVYPVIFDVEGIPQGVYHYDVKGHRLDLVKKGDPKQFFQDDVITHPRLPNFEPAVAFVFSTIFERSMFRYRESRSYRVMQNDIGHLIQTCSLCAAFSGREVYQGYSIHDSAVEKYLGLDGMHESAMAFVAVG